MDIKKVSTKGPMKDFRTNLSIFFISFSVFPHAGTCPIRPMPKGINFYLSFYLFSIPAMASRPYGRNPCNCIELFRPAIHRWLASPHRPPPSDAAIPALALAGQNASTPSLAMRQSRQDTRRTTAGEPERTLVREDSAKGVQRRRLSAIPHRYQRSMGRGRHTEVLLFTCLNGKIAAPAASIGIPTAKASTWKGGSLWLVKPLKPSNNI